MHAHTICLRILHFSLVTMTNTSIFINVCAMITQQSGADEFFGRTVIVY